MHIQQAVKELIASGFPTAGEAAETLWRWSNDPCVPVDVAIGTMREMGYKPLSGYPLTRS